MHTEFLKSLRSGYKVETVTTNDVCQIKLINAITYEVINDHQWWNFIPKFQLHTMMRGTKNFKGDGNTDQLLPLYIYFCSADRKCMVCSASDYVINFMFLSCAYAFQSESTLYSCVNVKERLARSRREIWNLNDCNWTWCLFMN